MANAITIQQAWDGVDLQLEQGSGGNDASSATVYYIVHGANSEEAACTACFAYAPETYAGIAKKSVAVSDRLTDASWKIEVRYGSENSTQSSSASDENDEATVNFDCSAGTLHMTQAISQECVYSVDDEEGNANAVPIGWNGKYGSESEAAGVDVVIGDLRETYTKVLRRNLITSTAWKRKIASLTGKVNSGSFKGWNPGECMFLGCSYSAPVKGASKVTVSFHFSIRLNESNAVVAGRSIGSKKGFDYIWALTDDAMQSGDKVRRVKSIYRAKVCYTGNFSSLGV